MWEEGPWVPGLSPHLVCRGDGWAGSGLQGPPRRASEVERLVCRRRQREGLRMAPPKHLSCLTLSWEGAFG